MNKVTPPSGTSALLLTAVAEVLVRTVSGIKEQDLGQTLQDLSRKRDEHWTKHQACVEAIAQLQGVYEAEQAKLAQQVEQFN